MRWKKVKNSSHFCSFLFSFNRRSWKNLKTYSTKELNILLLYVFRFFQEHLLNKNKMEQKWLLFLTFFYVFHAILCVNYCLTDRPNVTQGQIACCNLGTENLITRRVPVLGWSAEGRFAHAHILWYPSNGQILLEILQNLVQRTLVFCNLIGINMIRYNENQMFLHKQAHSYSLCRNIQFSLYLIVLLVIQQQKLHMFSNGFNS